MQHETIALKKRRKKSRKKKRKKLNSSINHADGEPASPTNPNNRSDEINLFALTDLTITHHQSSPAIVETAIPIDEPDGITNLNNGRVRNCVKIPSNEPDGIINPNNGRIRNCLKNFQNRIHHSLIYHFWCLLLHQIRKFLRRYRCWKKPERDGDSNDNADQIPLIKKIYEFYNAPVTKFFQDLIFFVIFLAMFTYVALIKTPPKPSVCEWILMSYLTTMAMEIIREILMMNETRWKTWLSVYFHDVLHTYDTFCCLMFALAFGLRLTDTFRIVGRLLLCINLSLWYLRMFHFLVVSKEVGPYIHIAARNVSKILFRILG